MQTVDAVCLLDPTIRAAHNIRLNREVLQELSLAYQPLLQGRMGETAVDLISHHVGGKPSWVVPTLRGKNKGKRDLDRLVDKAHLSHGWVNGVGSEEIQC